MTAKEMIIKLNEYGIMYADTDYDSYQIYVEDSEAYIGSAYIIFDEKGNCIEVKKA